MSTFFCQNCNSSISIPFSFLGMYIECPNCNTLLKLELEAIKSVGNTGYEIEYASFTQLLKNKPSKS